MVIIIYILLFRRKFTINKYRYIKIIKLSSLITIPKVIKTPGKGEPKYLKRLWYNLVQGRGK